MKRTYYIKPFRFDEKTKSRDEKYRLEVESKMGALTDEQWSAFKKLKGKIGKL